MTEDARSGVKRGGLATGKCQDLSVAAFSGAARTVRTKINVTFEKLSRVTGYGPCAQVVSAVYTVCLEV